MLDFFFDQDPPWREDGCWGENHRIGRVGQGEAALCVCARAHSNDGVTYSDQPCVVHDRLKKKNWPPWRSIKFPLFSSWIVHTRTIN